MNKIRIFSIAFIFIMTFTLTSCELFDKQDEERKPTSKPLKGALLADWISLHLKLIRSTNGLGTPGVTRQFAYTSLALYESIVPSDKHYRSLSGQLQGLTSLLASPEGKDVCWSASANAALASILRTFYANTPGGIARIDSLENVYVQNFATEGYTQTGITAGANFGKEIAQAIVDYAKTDGFTTVHPPYVLPVGDGLWEPTPPAFAAAAVPYLGTNRTFVPGSITTILPTPPVTFSSDPSSPFYASVKEVSDVVANLTEAQKTTAAFWEDLPNGKYYTASGHFAAILRQLIIDKKLSLLESSVAYAKMCMAVNEAIIYCFQVKYNYNLIRPVTYIRKYMNQPAWSSAIVNPNHPEYPSGHSSLCMAAASALSEALGSNISFDDQTYSDVGFSPRHYNNFEEAAKEAGISRLYGGIHYKFSVDAGLTLGKKSAQNLTSQLQFCKNN
ncbi:vanadium-dependent haloperoxidase [Rhodocytophaga rosea]|uniref:Vanadium-dependent haloperoxidase n=1 Tax=Rhodocytophaga rosea TaxID=2704465 RepID=A0A6C0GJ30_9BACT|nr:vanadium-dependent haloperoxidase [Rhodocytophaga rosea]QHT68071.1 vanadium-dependent haloperoxidase [Rhodocytophaga rosea]